ncbi:MAG: hypothetical protein DPW16_00605 [Chloroflexi bacterium]|nr:hypothetical protein [Chloroflexota bacterium]
MKISKHLHKFHLHDSTVDALYFVPSEKRLILPIRLCDWNGDSEPDEIFGKAGLLVFHGVENFKTEPGLTGFVWDQNFGLEVLDLDYRPELNLSDGREGVWGLFEFKTIPRDKPHQNVLEISFTATHFEWLETQQ